MADVLLEGRCLPLQLLPCGWAEPERCTSQLLRESERCLGVDAVPGRVHLERRWRARCQGALAEDCRL